MDWKLANVTPIHKKGPKNRLQNYRPISITSQACRVMETILKEEILDTLETNNQLRETQHGFLPNKSCVTNILTFLEYTTRNIDDSSSVDAIYLDFSKAFDTVPHRRLLIKMGSLGIDTKTILWVESWLKLRAQRVIIRGTKSEWRPVTSGVPQGSVLGPLLFLIYINDIDEGLTSKIIKFADDTKLYRRVVCREDQLQLQRDIDQIHGWSNTWQMSFNPFKCKALHFGKKNPCNTYTIAGESIENVSQERDLGVLIRDDLDWDAHVAKVVSKANSVLGMIWRTYECKSMKNIIQLYKTLVRPHLEYAVQAWRPYKQHHIDEIEKVQKRATRMITGFKELAY